MTEKSRRAVFLIIAAVIICAELLLAADTLKPYSYTVPVVVGPYREALFAVLTFLLVITLGFAFRKVNGRMIAGMICIAFSLCWFSGQKILIYRDPDSLLLEKMDHLLPLVLVIFGIGVAFWVNVFLPDDGVMRGISDKKRFFLALLLLFIILQPVLKGGFYWDDAFFSVEAQNMRLSGTSIFERVWKEIVDYVRIGRINPFATFHFLIFYYLPDVRFYKLFLTALTLLSGWLFYRFLRLWMNDGKDTVIVLVLTALCFQFRLYHDPLNSYYGLMQMMFCELMGALIHYLHWLREGKKSSLMLSLLFFTMGLMSYEMFFPLTALFLIPAWCEKKNFFKAVRRMLPWLLMALLIFGISMLLRGNITDETAYNGTAFSLDIPVILRTFATQVGAAFPLSYRNAGYDTGLFGKLVPWHTVFNTSVLDLIRSIQWQDLLACLILAILLKGQPREKMNFSLFGLLFGIMLWLLPGLVISLSEKYQMDLDPGIAYIPVYFSYFGMGLMLCECFILIGKLISEQTMRLVITGAGCMVLLLTMQDNRHVSQMLDNIFLYPRKVGEEALQAGILGEGDQTEVISAVPYSLWEHGWLMEPYQDVFYSLNARRPVNAVGEMDYVNRFREDEPNWITPADTVLIRYEGKEEIGFAKSGSLAGTAFDFEDNKLLNPMVSEVYFYISGSDREGVSLVYETRDAEWKQLPLKDAWPVRKTANGSLYKLQENRPVLFETIGIRLY